MAVSQGERLRKKAAKAAKRKTVVAQRLAEQRRELAISKPRHIDLAASPLVDCLLIREIETDGKAELLVARKLTLGRYAVASFMLDFFCLGVEDAHFHVEDAQDYEDYRAEVVAEAVPIEPSRALKLLHDAVAYGAANGFPPLEDFADVARLLGDVEPGGEPFAFGDNGRPHYVIHPAEDRRQTDYIIGTLTEKLGPDGFDITYPLEEAAQDPR